MTECSGSGTSCLDAAVKAVTDLGEKKPPDSRLFSSATNHGSKVIRLCVLDGAR